MFEKVLLDRAQRRSRWSWMGLAVQGALVFALTVVPMINPEFIAVVLPKSVLHVPLTPAPPVEQPVEVEVGRAPAANALSPVRRAARVFTAPSRYDNPVASIIDAPDASFLPFDVGSGRVIASTHIDGTPGPSLPMAAPAPPPAPAKPAPPADPVRVGGVVKAPQVLERQNPVYPPLAKQAGVSGTVKLEGVIARDGTVQRLRVLSGHPLLVKAALDAVTRWRYTPTLLNGTPVEVIAPIEVNFVLSR